MKTIEQRLLSRTVEEEKVGSPHVDTPCWVCSYTLMGGYPTMKIGGRNESAHRVAQYLYGESPTEEKPCVLHLCDHKNCVNPGHLRVGTILENNSEMAAKGRAASGERNARSLYPERTARGVRQWQAKLTEEGVRYIRMWAKEGFTHKKIAAAFKVSRMTVSGILRGETWAHVI